MRNLMRPDIGINRPQVNYPGMPNQYTTPQNLYQAPAPYIYMKKQQENPMQKIGLLRAFQFIRKPAQKKTNSMRHPSDALRGY